MKGVVFNLRVSKEHMGFYFTGYWLMSAFILESSCDLSFVSFLLCLFSGSEKNLYFLIPSRQISLKKNHRHKCYKEQRQKSQKMKPVTAGKGGGSRGAGVTAK